MSTLNSITLIGRLTADPELKVTTSGHNVANFSLAVDRPTGQSGVQQTDFINIVAWRENADRATQECAKGSLVLVEGRIRVRSYETAEGDRRWVTEVEARHIQALDRKRSGSTESDDFGNPDIAIAQKDGNAIQESDFDFEDSAGNTASNAAAPMPNDEIPEDVPF